MPKHHPVYGELMASDKQELPVDLTEHEILEYGQEAARLHATVEDRAIEEKDRRAEWSAEQKLLISQHSEINRWVADGKKPGEVKVEIYGNYRDNAKYVVRVDTGELVNECSLTEAEAERLRQVVAFEPREKDL